MVEVSEIGLKEDEIELDLGLSIGGSFRRAEKFKPVKKIGETLLVFPSIINAREAEEEVDPQTKREIQALKRKEAKRKREEKQLQQQQQKKNKKKHDSLMENQASCRTDRVVIGSACIDIDQMVLRNESANPASYSAIAPVQYPYAPVQLTNGLGFPCVTEKNGFFQPTACRSFRPYQGNRKTSSNASPLCSSSVGSDHYTSSHEGGGSSDSRSHSSYSLPEQHRLNGQKANYSKGHSEYSASSHSVESNHGNTDRTNHIEKVVRSNITQPSPTGPKEEATPLTEAVPSDKCISTTENSSPGPVKETKIGKENPIKPETQTHKTPCLPQMPYVSATGNGPNGKTVTGFLYRYTKSEVSIVCVCHGSTFSPAEFVQHAGGTDVTHPLKHITVVPSAYG